MAECDDLDKACREFFQLCVEKEQAKKLTAAEKKEGKGTTVRKVIKDGLGEDSALISLCEATIMPKYQDKKTKKIRDEDFVKKVMPELAAAKLKCKNVDDPKTQEELTKMKKKLCAKLLESQAGPTCKNAAVVERLTDTSKYTGSHQARFDESGKGKGIEGRKDIEQNTGYVASYKGQGTFDKK